MEMPSKQQGLIATIAVHGLVLALLFLLDIVARVPEKPAGATVNFGLIDEGMGETDPAPLEAARQVVPEAPVAESRVTPEVRDNADEPAPRVLTQQTEDALAVKKQNEERIERERLEKEKREREEAERKKLEEERILREKQQAQVNAMKDRQKRSFGGNTAGSGALGEGITGNAGNQGDPTGSVDASRRGQGGGSGSGISYSLEGRNVIGTLAKPEYNINDYGVVVVQITVNKDGIVVNAISGAKGSTTMDSRLLEAARKAALTARFNKVTSPDAPTYQVGTIMYHFRLL